MRDLIEVVKDLDRDTTRGGGGDNIRTRRPRGEGNGPQEGCFWFRGSELIPVEGSANEIVNHAGHAVLLDPETYGLTSEEIMKWLEHVGDKSDPHSPAGEYRTYLAGDADKLFSGGRFDPSRHALMWKSSKVVFEHMLKMGWAWIIYHPPERVHFTVTPNNAKFALQSAANIMPLLQIDDIRVTLVSDFSFVSAKHPHMGRNKTLSFSTDHAKGSIFGANFNAAMDWAGGKEAPESNYLYFVVPEGERNIMPSKLNVKTPKGYRQRWVIKFQTSPAKLVAPEGMLVARLPASVQNRMLGRKHWEGGLTPPNKAGARFLYADSRFALPTSDVEVLRDGQWTSY